MKSNIQIKRDYLKNVLIFSGFRSKSFYLLAHQAEEKRTPPYGVVVEQGSNFSGLIILTAGEVEVTRVVQRQSPQTLVQLSETRPLSLDTDMEIRLAKVLADAALGWIEPSEFQFRIIAANKPVTYMFIPVIALRDILDTLELGRVRTFLQARSKEFTAILNTNIFYKDLLLRKAQPELTAPQINFFRKTVHQPAFQLRSTTSLPRLNEMQSPASKLTQTKLDLLPLDFMNRHRLTGQSKKPLKTDSINIRLIRKSIEKLRAMVENPIRKTKSRFLAPKDVQGLFR